MIAAMVWAVYSLLTKKIGSVGWNVILTTRRIFFYGILFMIPASAFLPFRWDLGRLANGSYAAMLLYLGLGACAMCHLELRHQDLGAGEDHGIYLPGAGDHRDLLGADLA